MFHFTLKYGWDIRFQKSGGGADKKKIRALAITRAIAVPFQHGQKFTGENQMTSDN